MGNGRARYCDETKRYFVDLSITGVAHDAPELWKTSFKYVSELLFDATHGQMQLGTIFWLKQGGLNEIDDVFLYGEDIGGSSTANDRKDKEPFIGHILSDPSAVYEPLITLHEIGHYVFCLQEEYDVNCDRIRRCTNDPSTHACIMEFARGYGIKINDQGGVTKPPEKRHVTDFCYKDHASDDPHNFQQEVHQESCWETMKSIHGKLKLPKNPVEPLPKDHKHIDVVWKERSEESRFFIFVVGSELFTGTKTTRAIKNALRGWADFALNDQHQLGIYVHAPGQGLVRKLANFDQGSDKDVGRDELNETIENLEFGPYRDKKDLSSLLSELDFRSEDADGYKEGAYNYLVLLVPGDEQVVLPLDSAAAFLTDIRLQVLATTFGGGDLATQFSELTKKTKWLRHTNVPATLEDPEAFALSLQNTWLKDYFFGDGKTSVVGWKSGVIPPVGSKIGHAKHVGRPLNGRPLNFEDRSTGMDFPVLIESTATSARFILSEFGAGDLEMTLLTPVGCEIDKTSNIFTATSQGANVTWLQIDNLLPNQTGRWIVRLRRVKGRTELPYQVMVTADNQVLFVNSDVKVSGKEVNFEVRVFYKRNLDFAFVGVKVYKTLNRADDNGKLYKTIFLQRERKPDPSDGSREIEISSGKLVGKLTLEPGNYMALIHASNSGRSAWITNPKSVINGNLNNRQNEMIPPFERVQKIHFVVK